MHKVEEKQTDKKKLPQVGMYNIINQSKVLKKEGSCNILRRIILEEF